jgi:hypothetical protein
MARVNITAGTPVHIADPSGLTPPPEAFTRNIDSAERGLVTPVAVMQPKTGVRNRQHQAPSGQAVGERQSTTNSEDSFTPSSSDNEEHNGGTKQKRKLALNGVNE